MALDSEQAAVDALMNDTPEQAPQAPTETPPQGQGPTETEPSLESFTNIDPNNLPDELRNVYRSMQADYTRKTQEIAQLRQLGQPEQVALAVEVFNRLQYDPSFQQQIYNDLSQYLNVPSNEAPTAPTQNVPDYDEEVDWDEEVEGGYDPRVDELSDKLGRIEQYFQQQEEAQAAQRLEMQLDQYLTEQTVNIRQAHPTYTDQDMDFIYGLAHQTNGNLYQAQALYEGMRQQWASGYLNQKASAPGPAPIQPTANGEQPRSFSSLDDPDLERAAAAMLAVDMAD